MLDLNHPITPYKFQAAGLMDGVGVRARKMSVSTSAVRTELLAECLLLFAEMRELARARFSKRAGFIVAAVHELEAAIRVLAGLGGGQITVDRRDGEGACPACGAAITKFRPIPDEDHWVILCSACTEPLSAALKKLDSSEGFGACFI